MAERATEPENGLNEVVDLNNDARWQARLEEARARRAEALKLKGMDDKPRRAPSKPWEDEANTALDAEKHQRALDDDGLDFHDRMNALQKVLKEKQPKQDVSVKAPVVPDNMRNWAPEAKEEPLEALVSAPEPVKVETPAVRVEKSGPPVDSFFDDPAFSTPEPADVPSEEPEFVPMEALVDPLPPRRPKQTRRPWIEEAEAEERIAEEVIQDVRVESKARKSEGMPFLLGIGLVALVAMPFFYLLPPMTRGPEGAQGPVFGMQPAFGITAAMVEFPVATQSGEFVPKSSIAPIEPFTVLDGTPPAFSRAMPSIAVAPEVEAFSMPEVSRHSDEGLTQFARADLPRFQVTQAMWEARTGTIDGLARLPGVLAPVTATSLIPRPRP
ncbi:MAG: hypothetical protein HKP37_05050 [Boseongicola sp.]|nr:hypothetical protein [Boseongicola sp.]